MDIIREDFLHFLWENLHFSQSGLHTTCGKVVRILHTGYRNEGDGADYRMARIRIGDMVFCGDVELHKVASEWNRHAHQRDSRYERVILHVVVHDDLYRRRVYASDGHRIPTLELHSALPLSLARLWRAWHRPVDLPCTGLVSEIPQRRFETIAREWDRDYFNHRLSCMTALYPKEFPLSTAWHHMLVRGVFQGLGYHKNQESMLRLADVYLTENLSSAYKKNNKRKINIPDIVETTGKNGITGTCETDRLRQAGEMLLQKAGLQPGGEPILRRTDWDFSACRPANRPSVRIPQAATIADRLTAYSPHDWLRQPPHKLWNNACTLKHLSPPGRHRRLVLFHNVIIPAVYLLGNWIHDKKLQRIACRCWTEQQLALPPSVRRTLENSGFPTGKHLRKLAILHHFKYCCSNKRCYECGIMMHLVQA